MRALRALASRERWPREAIRLARILRVAESAVGVEVLCTTLADADAMEVVMGASEL